MIAQALNNLRPGSQWSFNGDLEWKEVLDSDGNGTGVFTPSGLVWHDNTVCPSKEEIESEIASLEAQYASTEYQRLRQTEYPPIADLADALYWQAQGDETKMTAYLAKVEAVKQKYPKGTE
jgi:hypothetical protein